MAARAAWRGADTLTHAPDAAQRITVRRRAGTHAALRAGGRGSAERHEECPADVFPALAHRRAVADAAFDAEIQRSRRVLGALREEAARAPHPSRPARARGRLRMTRSSRQPMEGRPGSAPHATSLALDFLEAADREVVAADDTLYLPFWTAAIIDQHDFTFFQRAHGGLLPELGQCRSRQANRDDRCDKPA
jgi:hypothetical protein